MLTPFLRQGLERLEKVVYIMDNHTAEEVLAYLKGDGLDPGPYLESGQLAMLDISDAYMKDGIFDPAGMIRLLIEETQSALDQGYTALRATGEMTWALKDLPGSERLIEYEAKLNHFFPNNKCLAICQYDRRRFSPETLLDVIRTHPLVVLGSEIHDNFYYIPPDEFLAKKMPTATLESWIHNLEERKSSETALSESEEKYRLIVDNAEEGIWLNDADRRTLFVNKRMSEMLGYGAGEIINRHMHEFVAPEDAEDFESHWERRRGGIDEQYDIRMIRRDGGVIHASLTAAAIFDEQKEFVGSVSMITDVSRRKKIEEELRETRDYLDSLITYANASIIVWDPQMRITRFNDACEFLTGYNSEDVMGRELAILFPEDSSRESLDKIRLTLEGHQWESVEIPILSKDGNVHIALWNSANIYGRDGELLATIAQGQDITERKRQEKELFDSRERLQRSFDVVGDAMFIIDTECRVQQHNRALCELLGKEADFTGRKCHELMHCFESPPDFCICMDAMRTGRPIHGEIYEPTLEKYLAVSLAPIFNEAGEMELGVHVIRDITERTLAEKAIQESEGKYRRIVDNALEGIWTIDAEGLTTYVNPRMAGMLGYGEGEMVGRSTFDLVTEEDLEFQKHQLGRRKLGITEQFDLTWMRKDGSRLYTTVHASPIMDESGQLLSVIRFVSDITQRKEAEDALARELEVNRAVADLSAALLTKASIKTISTMVLDIARRLTESGLGYVGYIDADTGNLAYVSLDTAAGGDGKISFQELKKVPIVAMEKRHGFYSNEPVEDRRSFKGPLHGFPAERFIWVPALMGETQIGQISLANSVRDYDEKDIELLTRLADIYAVALLRMWSEEELELYRQHLEELVKERTLDLDRINRELETEIIERKSKEKALRDSAAHLRALSTRLQSVREEERRSIALDVHDTLGQALTGLKIGVSLLKKKVAGEPMLEERLEGMSQLIDETIKTVREISAQLRPGMLEDFGLVAALEWQLDRFKEFTGLEYILTSNIGEESLDGDLSMALFRIAQEAMTNVARHAEATKMELRLNRGQEAIELEVVDDGKGIEETCIVSMGSMGILGMKERAMALGGDIEMRGEEGRGTTLVARIPYGQVKMETDENGYEVENQ
ncbi:MAG: hypothetical protein A2W01_00155 [Candidatus Solincola sediminis]|nr:MAG: hypothetical protein A2W01_00155 [Candidatus Solincola sediminis]